MQLLVLSSTLWWLSRALSGSSRGSKVPTLRFCRLFFCYLTLCQVFCSSIFIHLAKASSVTSVKLMVDFWSEFGSAMIGGAEFISTSAGDETSHWIPITWGKMVMLYFSFVWVAGNCKLFRFSNSGLIKQIEDTRKHPWHLKHNFQ